MNGPPRKQVLEQLDALRREIAEYHRWLAEFPAVCRVLENLMLRVEHPLPGTEQARYRSISNLRDELRAMAAPGVPVDRSTTPAPADADAPVEQVVEPLTDEEIIELRKNQSGRYGFAGLQPYGDTLQLSAAVQLACARKWGLSLKEN